MDRLLILCLLWTILSPQRLSVSATECMKRTVEISFNIFNGVRINRTVKCDMFFQWTVSDYCCYDKYDRFYESPSCCYSETYKLVLAVGFICLVLLGCSFSIFLCWIYNLPHYLLYLFSCGKFSLNDWTSTTKNSPYVDPSFYSGEPFWARGAEMQHYPLRPMPPKVFYPAPPPKLKYRWDMAHGELPLFIVASRQFTRNPYSARPQDRNPNPTPIYHETSNNNPESRRNSLNTSTNDVSKVQRGRTAEGARLQNQGNYSAHYNRHRKGTASSTRGIINSATSRKSSLDHVQYNPPQYGTQIDEADAAQELMDALKFFDDEDRINNNASPTEWKNDGESDSTNGGGRQQQDIFVISGNNSSTVGCSSTRTNDERLGLDQIRPNTTGSYDQYGSFMSLSGITDSQRLKLNSRGNLTNPNNLGLPVYGMPGVHTAGVLNTVQNYHVVSSNLGNPMETILEDESFDEYPIKSDDLPSPVPSSSPSTPNDKIHEPVDSNSSLGASSVRALTKLSLQRDRLVRTDVEFEKPDLVKRRASSIAAMSTGSRTATSSPVPSTASSTMNHVLGPTPTARAFVPFNPTLPGSLSEHAPISCDYSCDKPEVAVNKARRNSVI